MVGPNTIFTDLLYCKLRRWRLIALLAASPGGIKLPPDGSTWGVLSGLPRYLRLPRLSWCRHGTQSLVPAVTAAIIMTMEPVFAGIFGRIFRGKNPIDRYRLYSGPVSAWLTAMLIVCPKIITENSTTGKLTLTQTFLVKVYLT